MIFGFIVKIKFKEDSPFRGAKEEYKNVTEVHYGYKSAGDHRDRVAFESDIHSTGLTHKIEYIEVFEVLPASKKYNSF